MLSAAVVINALKGSKVRKNEKLDFWNCLNEQWIITSMST